MKKLNTILLKALVTFSLSCGTAFAADGPTGYVGGLVGVDFPNGNSGSSISPVFGATAGVKLAPQFGVGFFGTYYGQNNSGSIFGLPTGTSTSTVNLMGEANFFASLVHLGADVGYQINSWSSSAGNASMGSSSNALVYGPEAGVDIPLGSDKLTLGAEAHYLFNSAASGQNNLLLMGAVKIWF